MTITPFEIAISDAARHARIRPRLFAHRAAQLEQELVFGFGGENVATVDRDHFLTDLSIYWFTGTGGSAANSYLEDGRANGGDDARRNEVPTGAAVFPDDFRSVRAFSETNNNIVHWTQMPRGGHFALVYESELLAADVAKFFRSL